MTARKAPPRIAPGIKWDWKLNKPNEQPEGYWTCKVGSYKCQMWPWIWPGSFIPRVFEEHSTLCFNGASDTAKAGVSTIQRELIRIRTALAIVPNPDGGK